MPTIDERRHSAGPGLTSRSARQALPPFEQDLHDATTRAARGGNAAAGWASSEGRCASNVCGAPSASDVAALRFSDLVKEYLADRARQGLHVQRTRASDGLGGLNSSGPCERWRSRTRSSSAMRAERLLAKHRAEHRQPLSCRWRAACVNFGRVSGCWPPGVVWPPRLMLTEGEAPRALPHRRRAGGAC